MKKKKKVEWSRVISKQALEQETKQRKRCKNIYSIHLSKKKNRWKKSVFEKQFATHPYENDNSNNQNKQTNSINCDLENANKQKDRRIDENHKKKKHQQQ